MGKNRNKGKRNQQDNVMLVAELAATEFLMKKMQEQKSLKKKKQKYIIYDCKLLAN